MQRASSPPLAARPSRERASGSRVARPRTRRPRSGTTRAPSNGHGGSGLLPLAVATGLLAAVEAVLLLSPAGAPWPLVLFPVAALTWFAAGAVATRRRPANRMGAIMLAGSLVWLVAGLANASHPVLAAAGLVVAALPLALVAHLLHAFPSGRLRGTASRVIVAGIYVAALALQAPSWLFLPDGAGSPLQVADRPDLAQLGQDVQDVVGGGLMLATAVLLVVRLRATSPAQRRVLAPLALYGIVAVVLVPLLSRLRGPLLGDDPLVLFTVQAVLLALVPVAFVAAVLRGGFAPSTGIRDLSARLGADGRRPGALRDLLADALGDPSVQLTLWAGDHEYWVDADGRPTTLPAPGSSRDTVIVAADGRRVGAIVYDARLIADAGPVRDAAGVIAYALDRERLTAEILAGREHLRRSRERIATAADEERRRIVRDLHDGVQGRLVLLGLRADALARDPDDPRAVRAAAETLHRELDATQRELRELVRGVLPAVLVERGLGAAADELADRMPLPTTIDADDERYPAAVESAGWFAISEALANVVKHAGARTAAVRIAPTASGVRIEVHDDGAGGATTDVGAGSAGSGLRGIADRVDVLGGRVTIDSPPGAGTRIVVEVPCGS